MNPPSVAVNLDPSFLTAVHPKGESLVIRVAWSRHVFKRQ